jgi:hypothetical protein
MELRLVPWAITDCLNHKNHRLQIFLACLSIYLQVAQNRSSTILLTLAISGKLSSQLRKQRSRRWKAYVVLNIDFKFSTVSSDYIQSLKSNKVLSSSILADNPVSTQPRILTSNGIAREIHLMALLKLPYDIILFSSYFEILDRSTCQRVITGGGVICHAVLSFSGHFLAPSITLDESI